MSRIELQTTTILIMMNLPHKKSGEIFRQKKIIINNSNNIHNKRDQDHNKPARNVAPP